MSCDLEALAKPGIRSLHPYLPGKPVSELERELGITNIVKLASNENPLPVSESIREAMLAEFDETTRYPDSNAYYLKEAISAKTGVAMNGITVGNGSNDVLDMIARVFAGPGDEVMFSQHAFVVYPIVTQCVGATPVVIPALNWGHDLNAMAAAITDKTRLIYIANPNNPTGTCLMSDELKAFMDKVPAEVIVVIDEAYYEYASDPNYPNTVSWLTAYPNLVITRTFSKAYGLAALRVGYSLSSNTISGLLNRVRHPFNSNSVGLAAATAALKDDDYLKASVEINASGMSQLISMCDEMGLEYIPSSANFLTIDMAQEAAPLYQAYLHEGVIVRPVANYEMPNHLRISIGLEQENERFIAATRKVLGK